ncbi:MAG TPA: heme o synthase, partial [Gaiellales bacterium]|nr:heme o synthase [Gaiellales bacterium]
MESTANAPDLVGSPAVEGATPEGAGVPLAGAVPRRRLRDALRDYLALTKPRIIVLLLITTVTTMFVADPSGPSLATILWTMLGGYLAAGGAGAINHFVDRDRDARMARTCDRPLVTGRIEPNHGLMFGIALAIASIVLLAVAVNPVAAALALSGLLGYVFVYTLWLKPLTPQNIVIGGAAGAVPPLVGWAAATGGLTWDALYPFAIVFLWTPPHFWALALLLEEDYSRAGVPMLPSVRGSKVTAQQVLVYTVLLTVSSLVPVALGTLGWLYAVAAVALGA